MATLDMHHYAYSELGTEVSGYHEGDSFPSGTKVQDLPDLYPEIFKWYWDYDNYEVVGHASVNPFDLDVVGGGMITSVVGARPPHR